MRVSVILTTYNSAKTIQSTLNSILLQQGRDSEFELELLVVDDASTDNTPHILAENNIQFITNGVNSGGPNKGRNIGLREASGEYICFCDHDDIWEANKIKKQLEIAHLAPIITCGYKLINLCNSSVEYRCRDGAKYHEYGVDETFLCKLSRNLKGQSAYFSTIMIHKSLKDIQFEERFGMLDYDWLLRIFRGRRSVEVTDCLVKRFVDGTNLSLNSEYRKNDYYHSLYVLELYEKEYPKLVSRTIKKINGSRARYFYLMDNMKLARKYFLRSALSWKVLLYYLSSYAGSNYVKKKFTVFG